MGTTGQSITLANSIIGVGILAMPFCFQQCGLVLATLILISMGLVSRLCCYFLLKSALLARRRNFEFLAFHVFGSAGKLTVEVGIIGFLMGTCIAYFVVVGDLGPQIIAKLLNINQSDILRTSIMVIVSLVCVLPLGLLRNVDSLSNVSAATICFYFCLVIKIIAEAAYQLFSPEIHGNVAMWRPAGFLQCVPIFSMALFCQTQLFEIFESMPMLSMEKMNLVTKNAINICTGVYFTLGLFGYVAFAPQKISGNILMSLSPTMASDVIKLGFVMSVAFSFPLIIFPCRASLYSFLYKKVHSSHHDHIINHSIPETTFRCITVSIIAVSLFISLLVPDIELVLGIVGATIGVMVCVVFPAACFVKLTLKETNEKLLAKGILILGLCIMVLGTYANLQAAESKQSTRYDEKAITQERIDKMVEDFFDKMEKSDDTIIKPIEKIEIIPPVPSEDQALNKLLDSEIQPPNPIPPESQSNEAKKPVEVLSNDDKLPIDETDKASETHPKNLKKSIANGSKLANGQNVKSVKQESNKIEEVKEPLPPKEEAKEVQKEKEVVPDKNQEKIDINIKQEKLIETIKQQGEEQKELIKEQKEILQEILKTKDEMQQIKKGVDSNEAKKIAVESIQKIANMAIQSLSGVSDKPLGNDVDKKSEPLEKVANEAVQEIAKKAVETIEAIKESQDKEAMKNPVVANVNNVEPNNIANVIQANPNAQPNVAQPNVNEVNAQGQLNAKPIETSNSVVNANNKRDTASVSGVKNPAPPGNFQPNVNNIVQPAPNGIQSVPPVIAQQQNSNANVNKVVAPVNAPVQNPPIQNQPQNQQVVQDQHRIQPAQNQPQIQPVVQNQPQIQPAQNQPQIQPAQNQPQIQPAQSQPQIQPAQSQPQIQPAQSQPQIQPAQSQPQIQPAQSQPQIQPAQSQPQIQSAQSQPQIQPVQNQPQFQPVQNQPIQNHLNGNQVLQKDHSHSPDEPQSYKQGEDSQKLADVNKNVAQNIPIPLAMNGNHQEKQPEMVKPVETINSMPKLQNSKDNNIPQNDGAKSNIELPNMANPAPIRQKREVVDCTKMESLKAEDQEICKTNVLPNNLGSPISSKIQDVTEDVLKNVDLNNVLQNRVPIDTLHLRSLKSYDDTKKR